MFKIIIAMFFICIFMCNAIGASIAGGGMHSLALKDDGTVWGWGHNYYGELTGSNVEFHTPVQASGISDVVSISAGFVHTLVLKSDGTVWSFGKNDYGQLGDGTDEQRNIPVRVVGLSGVRAIASHAAADHSLAVKNDGTVWTWGQNYSGELGDGTTTHRAIPVQVIGLSEAIAVSAGEDYSLALRQDGTVWAWGDNNVGQLGDGTRLEDRLAPVQVRELTNVISISAGTTYSMALKSDGTVWRWGLKDDYLDDNDYYDLIPVQKSGVSGVIAIGGGNHFSLALTSYGKVWFWGLIEMHPDRYIWSIMPVLVDGISGAKAIAGGANHALFLKNDGTVWALGYNYFGQLGDGTTHEREYPVQVQGFSLTASSVPASVMAADFDEDGRADPSAVDSSGQWFFWHSSQTYSREGPIGLGMTGAYAAGDVDGDGTGDMALVDSSGIWHFWLSSRDYAYSGSEAFGVSGTPVLADFDGDGKADPTIVDSSGTWTVWLSGRGYSSASGQFAVSGATPVAGDFDGDHKADPVMVDANGNWYFWLSSYFYQLYGNRSFNFGVTLAELGQAGKPVAGDFDGDRKADPAMMDSSGNWYFMLSTAFYLLDGPWYLVLP